MHWLMVKYRWFRIGLMAVLVFLPQCLLAQYDVLRQTYTDKRPLVYEDAWDLWPYCFLNDHGEPEGYNVDLVRMVCEEMGVPYVIRLKSTREALTDLKEGRSDLMLGLDNRYEPNGLHNSKSVVQLFTHSVVYPKNQPVTISLVEDLGRQKVIVHEGSFCHDLMQSQGWGDNAIPLHDMKAAIKRVSAEGKEQIVWNTMSLKWLMRKFQIDNLKIASVDMPHGAYKFMSRDTLLLACLDQAYMTLSVSRHHFEAIQNRWFYPEKVESGVPAWVWYVAVGGLLVMLVLLCLNVLYRARARRMALLMDQNTKRLSHILRLSQMHIWTYDVATRTFSLMDNEGRLAVMCDIVELSKRFAKSDFEHLREALLSVTNMEQEQATFVMRAIRPEATEGSEERDFSIVITVLRRMKGKPAVLLGTMSDITEERRRQQHTQVLLMRYKTIFETAMVDMVFYDEEGYMANLNKRAMHTFGMDKDEAVRLRINLKDIVGDGNFDLGTFDNYHVTRVMDVYNQFLPEQKQVDGKKIYYELQLVPVRDTNHRLLGVYGTGMEVTDFVNNWRQQKENIRLLKTANQEVQAYMENIDYVLKVGGVRMTYYSPQDHVLTIYRESKMVQFALTQSRCITLLADVSKKRAMRLLKNMDNRMATSIDTILLTNIRHGGQPIYLHVNLVPTYDDQGRVKGYFGMCRDVSDVKTTELQLERETRRAQEVEELKNSFLRNMSYEIRTPLAAVVGFAELFEKEHFAEDEEIFVREIKDNAAYLLELINDILFLSRLDAHMIEINRQPTDFAKTFESHCVIGWANNQKEGVRYLVLNHFEELVVDIDDTNLGRIINQIVANAAQHTFSGTVRARYDYIEGKLMIAVEDTGTGIPESEMEHIFERFNTAGHHGTGLGLPICRELARQMGGYISVNSRVGNGTTVWIIIPCNAMAMARKLEDGPVSYMNK